VGRANVTSADVAAAAGVSRATVSYVLNGVDARVSDETRRRVLDVARELGYTPHAVASALRAGRTSVVVLALPAWPLGPPIADMVTTIVGELEHLGYTPLVHFRHDAGPEAFLRACDRVRPVGLIAPGVDVPPERVQALQANGTRAVVALSAVPLDHIPALAFDQQHVGELALTHLAERGHTRVLAVTPTEPQLLALGQTRLRGARAVAEARGIELTAITADQLGEQARHATAVYAFNDEYALNALDALPDGYALIGTDDSPAARLSHPRLTTIALVQPPAWRRLAQRLHALIEDERADASPIVVTPVLIQGATT
jgi:DNA-binding LacI/PurR family transcriptional regulator